MNNINTYIESGMLELYALGDLVSEERLRVEYLASTNPPVRTELDEIEYALERYASENAISANRNLRDKVLNSLTIH